MPRPLWEMIVDVVESVLPDTNSGLRVSSAYLDMPVEVRVVSGTSGIDFCADVPEWRWATVFDPQRGRMKLSVGEGESS